MFSPGGRNRDLRGLYCTYLTWQSFDALRKFLALDLQAEHQIAPSTPTHVTYAFVNANTHTHTQSHTLFFVFFLFGRFLF